VQEQGRAQLLNVERELQVLSASSTERVHQLSDCQKDLKHERETRTLALQDAQAKLKILSQTSARLDSTLQAIDGQLVGVQSDFSNDRNELKELRKRAQTFADSLNRMHAQIRCVVCVRVWLLACLRSVCLFVFVFVCVCLRL
jgi:septal ring factor EnvC (AmiA/AmiB activator)